MKNLKIPVIDMIKTGKNIKNLRLKNKYSVKEIQNICGFEYPQAIYSWQNGSNIPSIDNLLILSELFNVSINEIIATK